MEQHCRFWAISVNGYFDSPFLTLSTLMGDLPNEYNWMHGIQASSFALIKKQ
jgi:hypothetical protein